MRSVLALLRASFLAAASYRLGMLISIVALLVSVVPIYFVAGALQPVVEESIRNEGGEYFAFILVGTAAVYLISSALSALPSAISGNLGSGTLEALLVTRTRLPAILLGMISYPMAQSVIRAALLIIVAAITGASISWLKLPAAVGIALITMVAYLGFALVSGALILVFRTSGPLTTAIMSGSVLLGGVYYSTSVIPSWIQNLSSLVPLTYGLRAIRMLLLGDAPFHEVTADIAILALFAVTLLAIGALAFDWALRYARRTGTLSQY